MAFAVIEGLAGSRVVTVRDWVGDEDVTVLPETVVGYTKTKLNLHVEWKGSSGQCRWQSQIEQVRVSACRSRGVITDNNRQPLGGALPGLIYALMAALCYRIFCRL